jgi:hypothetical protein
VAQCAELARSRHGDEMVAAMDKVGVDGEIFISAFSLYRYDASYGVQVAPDRSLRSLATSNSRISRRAGNESGEKNPEDVLGRIRRRPNAGKSSNASALAGDDPLGLGHTSNGSSQSGFFSGRRDP